MAHSCRQRHRDREPGLRQLAEPQPPALSRVFRIAEVDRQQIARCLRCIDEARLALELRNDTTNRVVIRDLRSAADEIYEVINELEASEE